MNATAPSVVETAPVTADAAWRHGLVLALTPAGQAQRGSVQPRPLDLLLHALAKPQVWSNVIDTLVANGISWRDATTWIMQAETQGWVTITARPGGGVWGFESFLRASGLLSSEQLAELAQPVEAWSWLDVAKFTRRLAKQGWLSLPQAGFLGRVGRSGTWSWRIPPGRPVLTDGYA